MPDNLRQDHLTFMAVCGLAGVFAASHLTGLMLDPGGVWARWLPFAGGAVAVVGLCWI